MMWYVQLLIDWAGVMLARDVGLNAVFAGLVLWSAFGRNPRVCAVMTAVVHLILLVS